jgi:C-terminal processing protease CtpA/Prc
LNEELLKMNTLKLMIPLAASVLLAGQAAAQSQDELERNQAELERNQAELERNDAEISRELEEQERRMAEAARRIAELTHERLPQFQQYMERNIGFYAPDKPRLGITIGEDDSGGPVEGVIVAAVTPGSAAADAGLRAGDIVTSINGETLSAQDSGEANQRVLDFMEGVESGDVLDLEYIRDGKVGTVEVEPRPIDMKSYAFSVPEFHVAPGAPPKLEERLLFAWPGSVWADMELVELSEGLGKYFGTDAGVLVVSAPKSDALQLEDGDVILSIDGRKPTSVRHALRILGSYQAGEMLELEIMREKRSRTLDIEIPDDRRSGLWVPQAEPKPATAPLPAVPPAPPVERT